jgi:D-amino-acid oxidase
VVGTGVVGLTTARAIRRRHPAMPVTVYAKDLDVRTTTSAIAAGKFDPAGLGRAHAQGAGRDRLDGWLTDARAALRSLQPAWQRYGIAERDSFTLQPPSRDNTGLVDLPFDRLNQPGRMERSQLLDPTRLLPALQTELVERGVRFEPRWLQSRRDLVQLDATVVVLCVGYGAKALLGDDALVPKRGHLVRLQRPTAEHDYLLGVACKAGPPCYVFCRGDDIVLGGTVITGDDRTAVHADDQAVFDRVLTRAAEVFAGRVLRCGWPGDKGA